MAEGCCSDEVHMEEEKVEIKVQAVEEEIGETRGREQGKEKKENKHSLRRMTHGWYDAHQHLSLEPMRCITPLNVRAVKEKK